MLFWYCLGIVWVEGGEKGEKGEGENERERERERETKKE
jgi:hypothetical protein